MQSPRIIIVIPAYKASSTVLSVAKRACCYADHVIVVDDNCPFSSGQVVNKHKGLLPITVLTHSSNRGVGAATKTGFLLALEMGASIIVKLDADNQMDPALVPLLIQPILDGQADCSKGNRFANKIVFLEMPLYRLVGNIALSFITKLSTGYWELFDPTNGFVAFSSETLKQLDLKKIHNRFLFETDMIYFCGLLNTSYFQLNMLPDYQDHMSSLNPSSEMPRFLIRNIEHLIKRLYLDYLVCDFNSGSISLILFLFSFLSAFVIALWRIYLGSFNGLETPNGIIAIFIVLAIASIQSLLNFLYFDATQKPLLRKLNNFNKLNIRKV